MKRVWEDQVLLILVTQWYPYNELWILIASQLDSGSRRYSFAAVRKFAIFESYSATRAILPFLKFDWSIWIIYEWLACILIFVWFKWQPQVESVQISCIWSLLFSLFSGLFFFFFGHCHWNLYYFLYMHV